MVAWQRDTFRVTEQKSLRDGNMSVDFEGFRLETVADDPKLVDAIQELVDLAFPVFVTQAHIPKQHTMRWDWFGVYRRWPQFQFILRDPADGVIVAAANSLALAWDGPDEELPETGWNWVMLQAAADQDARKQPLTGSALGVAINPAYQGRHLSQVALRAMKQLFVDAGLRRMLAPVRPTWKPRYPLIPMREYCHWTNAEGLPFDPWLRVHVRLGARIIKACDLSQPLAGSAAEWEKWLGLTIPASGDYVAAGLLSPMHMDYAADEGICMEPNVWVEHPMQ